MTGKEAARKVVQRLVLNGRPKAVIEARLEEMGLTGALDDEELVALLIEIRAARELTAKSDPKQGCASGIRLFGVLVILCGIAALGIDAGGMPPLRRLHQHPHGYGVLAILLGTLLVLKPRWGFEKVK